jgi:hypothetical protein
MNGPAAELLSQLWVQALVPQVWTTPAHALLPGPQVSSQLPVPQLSCASVHRLAESSPHAKLQPWFGGQLMVFCWQPPTPMHMTMHGSPGGQFTGDAQLLTLLQLIWHTPPMHPLLQIVGQLGAFAGGFMPQVRQTPSWQPTLHPVITLPATQLPSPLQTCGAVPPPLQIGGPQLVSVGCNWQPSPPEQTPVVPQVLAACAAHSSSGSLSTSTG